MSNPDDYQKRMDAAYLAALKTLPDSTKQTGQWRHMFQAGIKFALDDARELVEKLLPEPK